jgi:putative addiction module component (TIGR02574 family)
VGARTDRCATRIGKTGHAGYARLVTDRARQVLEDALTLSGDERIELAEQLLSSVPADGEWLAELERRARRAFADPNGGEAWDVVERRLAARVAR